MKTRRLLIHGRVQGVWFRESMRSEALRLNVTGWVRNTPNGTVEAVVQGKDAAVDALIEWAHRGPPQARVERVERVEVEAGESLGPFNGFDKRVD